MGIGVKNLANREQVFMRKVILVGSIVLSLLCAIGVTLMIIIGPNENLSETLFQIFTALAIPLCFSFYLLKGYFQKSTKNA